MAGTMLLHTFLALAGIGSFVSGSRRFPDSFRVEVELINFENPNSVDYLNRYCDQTTQCDTYISAYVDLETSMKPHAYWHNRYNKIFEVDNTDSPKINKVVHKDVCGGGLHIATLRAFVYDSDVSYRRTTIDEFDCRFEMDANHIAQSVAAAAFSPVMSCEARYRGSDHKLFARVRAYRRGDTNCFLGGYDAGNRSIPAEWIRQNNEVVLQDQRFRPDRPLRMEFQPVSLHNPRGVTFTGEPCEPNNAPCQPLFLAELDTTNAMATTFQHNYSRFGILAKYGETSPRMSEDIIHDVCGGELDWINLRVIVKHAPGWHEGIRHWHQYKTIEEFNCATRFAYWLAGRDQTATWGPAHDCFPRHQTGMRLDYRIRAYPIPLEECSIRDILGQDATRERAAYTFRTAPQHQRRP